MNEPVEHRVLIVDPNYSSAAAIAEILNRDGFRCDSIDNGVAALERLAESPAAFVLADLGSHGIGGIELLEQIAAHVPGAYVILMAEAADVPTVVRALREGANDFIAKPFTPDELRER